MISKQTESKHGIFANSRVCAGGIGNFGRARPVGPRGTDQSPNQLKEWEIVRDVKGSYGRRYTGESAGCGAELFGS